MKKYVLKLSALLMLAAVVSLSACKKGDADATSAEDAARGSYIMADAFSVANEANSTGGKSLKGLAVECYEFLLLDGQGFDLTFDNCTGDDGILRNGTIQVRFTSADAWELENNGRITISFVNYFHNGEGISGAIYAEIGVGSLGLYFTLGATDLKITYSNGDVAILNSAELTFTTLNFEFNGNSDGINRRGVKFSSISEGIKFGSLVTGGCSWPTEGIITITIEGEKEIVVNYDQDGTKACDNIMLVSQKRHDDVTVTLD